MSFKFNNQSNKNRVTKVLKTIHITLSLDLMCNNDIKGQKFVCLGVGFLAFNVLLHTKSEQKEIDFVHQ